ncbi:MAG: outer membrane protein assembly factor BamB family protein [Promethearchaeota archaeon]
MNATPWVFQTGKGIFSSPVVDADGTVYIESADHIFYALYQNGSVKWSIETEGVIDSSALLDNQGHVIFGSGDAHVYCLNRETGISVWTFKAHTEEEASEQFNLEIHNVNWFEGNIGMLADGTILAPNDNQILYALDRDTGLAKNYYLGNEMIWSLPAVNTETKKIFFGTTNFALKTIFAFNSETRKQSWASGGLGSVVASPMLTSKHKDAAVLVGSYDGILRAYTQRNGKQLWKVGMNDHIYASPAQLSDGTIIQPSADGTVYAIDPAKGKIIWKFDTLGPIRSSPAIDGNDTIYVGSGEGKLFAINPDGTLRWAYQLIDQNRNDLNASPALGPT